ncbi:hypothetical protein GE061_005729 [Apolygus lucorum]|uniref:Uncharacterized protein n=1 Tax=Apolygus lucorum TaxID=248454 RepID=A0A8S9WX09_APOLU|nr:hypothetical protein GE061_005729 [Apolygus lucorum]
MDNIDYWDFHWTSWALFIVATFVAIAVAVAVAIVVAIVLVPQRLVPEVSSLPGVSMSCGEDRVECGDGMLIWCGDDHIGRGDDHGDIGIRVSIGCGDDRVWCGDDHIWCGDNHLRCDDEAQPANEVQQKNPSIPALPTNNPGLDYLMRIPPRGVHRTGFQHVEIKVVPPSTTVPPQVTQRPPFTPEEEQLLSGQPLPDHGYSDQNYEHYNKQSGGDEFLTVQALPSHGYSQQNLEVFNSPADSKVETGSPVHHTQKGVGETNLSVLGSTAGPQVCPNACDKTEEEGRGRIKQEGDQVQLEMEQVIRTEMKDPEGVKLGRPYQTSQQAPRPDIPYQNNQYVPRPDAGGVPFQTHSHLPRPDNTGIPLPFAPFRPDFMTPVYMKPLYMKSNIGTNAPHWPPIVTSGDRLYIPHIVVDKEDTPPEIFPSKVYLVPIPRPLTLGHEDLMSAYSSEGRAPIPKEEPSGSYKPRPPQPLRPQPSFTYPSTFTYLLFPKDLRGK